MSPASLVRSFYSWCGIFSIHVNIIIATHACESGANNHTASRTYSLYIRHHTELSFNSMRISIRQRRRWCFFGSRLPWLISSLQQTWRRNEPREMIIIKMRITNKKAVMTGDGIDPFSPFFFSFFSLLCFSFLENVTSSPFDMWFLWKIFLRLNAMYWKPLYPIYYY